MLHSSAFLVIDYYLVLVFTFFSLQTPKLYLKLNVIKL